MKKNISIILMGAILLVSLCSCAEETANTSKSENEQATATLPATTPSEEPIYEWEEEPTEEVTEPLTEEGIEIVQITKDYVTALEKLDLDTLAGLYTEDALKESNIYDSLTKYRDNAVKNGISPDDYKAIWELTEVYDDITFTFDDYATCKIDGDTAVVKLKYTANCYVYHSVNEYCVVLKFPMINVDGKWYLNGDPNSEDSFMTYCGNDFDEESIKMDLADVSTVDINLVIDSCYSDIQSNHIEKYNVESAELITIADAVKVYGYEDAFGTIGNEKYGYNPYWYKTNGYTVFLNLDGVDVLNREANYSEYQIVALAENGKPSSNVYVVDLFK